jgi:hypothetical protein
MKNISSQVSVFELREARRYAGRLSFMVARDIWSQGCGDTVDDPFPLPELSVKESNRKDREDGEEADTMFTFRFEGGTVVKVEMHGSNDWNYGFQWWVTAATVRFYKTATDSAYSMLADPKSEIRLDSEFLRSGHDWWRNPLPVKA